MKDKNMKKIAIATSVLFLALAQPVQAEVIDISTVKCSDLATMNEEEASYLLIWLHGYYGGKAGDTTIDLEGFAAAGTDIGTKCGENPELGLMTVVQQLDN